MGHLERRSGSHTVHNSGSGSSWVRVRDGVTLVVSKTAALRAGAQIDGGSQTVRNIAGMARAEG